MLKVGEVAKTLEITTVTLRHYDKIGLVKPSQTNENGYRFYSKTDLEKLKFIKNAKHTGMTLKEIKQLLLFEQNPMKTNCDVKHLLSQKISNIESQIKSLKKFHKILTELNTVCKEEITSENCPILRTLQEA